MSRSAMSRQLVDRKYREKAAAWGEQFAFEEKMHEGLLVPGTAAGLRFLLCMYIYLKRSPPVKLDLGVARG